LIVISISESGEYRNEVEVVVIKFIKDLQHRPFSPELVEGWRRDKRDEAEQRTER
jgi:hypothetical protein